MYCPKCGYDLEDAEFCPRCGSKVSDTAKKPNYFLIGLCVLLVALAAYAFGTRKALPAKVESTGSSTSSRSKEKTKRLPYSRLEYQEKVLDFFYTSGYDKRFCEYLVNSVNTGTCRSVKNVEVDSIECTAYNPELGIAHVTVKGTFTACRELGNSIGKYTYEAVFMAGSSGEMSKIPAVTSQKKY